VTLNAIKQHALLIAFAASVLAVGVPYWSIPYSKLNLPSALIGPALWVVVASALLPRAGGLARFWRTVGVIGASVPAVVLARVVVDGIRDPTSHNLWPFEAIIALAIGFACALTGALAGSAVAKLRETRAGTRSA
jgi:hypothetical protein